MKLSIVIVNYNVKYFLEQCLDSVFRAIKNIDAEVLVVDNCSSDDSMTYLKPRFPQVAFIENCENLGFSKANNQAIKIAAGEYILLLNPDTVVGESTLSNVCEFMNKTPEAGGIGVKMLDGFGCFLPESKRGFPTPWRSFCKLTGLSALFPYSKTFGGYHMRYLDENKINKVEVLAGAFMLLRKIALEKSGLLDEHFFMYGEDIDLSYRISNNGYENYYLPEPIIHYKGESTKKDIKYVRNFYEAMLIFFDKHYPNSNSIIKVAIRLAIILTGSFSAVRRLIGKKSLENKPQSQKEIIFDTSQTTYDQIIKTMNENREKGVLFKIYHPERKITVAANNFS